MAVAVDAPFDVAVTATLPTPVTSTVDAASIDAVVVMLAIFSPSDTAIEALPPEAPDLAVAVVVCSSSAATSVMPALTVRPCAFTAPTTTAVLVTFVRLIATATPTESEPPSVAEDPSASAVPSVLADDRTVTTPPETTVTPAAIEASDWLLITLIAIAAATAIGPEESEAEGVWAEPLVVEPVFVVAWVLAKSRCSVTWLSTLPGAPPSSGAPASPLDGAPWADAVALDVVCDCPIASTVTSPPVVTLRFRVAVTS